MTLRALPLLLTGALLVSAPAPVVADETARTPGAPEIKRFQQVDSRLYRGGQPDAAGFEALKRMGIRTVVNLRHTDEERAIVESLGLRYVTLPTHLRPFGIGGGLRDETVRGFFELLDDPESGPIFLHCRRGADRTGTLVAMYRIARQGWSVDAAYDEARNTGMRWWHYSVKPFLHAFEAASLPQLTPASEPAAP